jgi:hypothetical protein
MWEIFASVSLGFVAGAVFGYCMWHRRLPDTALGELCGVIRDQSEALRASGRQALDAALVNSEQQLERAATERMADLGMASPSAGIPSPGRDYVDPGDLGSDPEMGEHTIPTEYP